MSDGRPRIPQRDIDAANRSIEEGVGKPGRRPNGRGSAVQTSMRIDPDVILTIAGSGMTYAEVLARAARCISKGEKW